MAKAKTTKKPAAKKKKPFAEKTLKVLEVPTAEAGAEEADSSGEGKALIIVESPAKAKTIGKYVGRGYRVFASVGHIKDLPKSKLGIDLENGFEPQYVTIEGKDKYLEPIRKAYRASSKVYLACDPDREGEAIAWHIHEELSNTPEVKEKPFLRVLFNEITKSAVNEALQTPTTLNQSLFEAQQTRRILDRLVGYKLSPILWDKVRRGLSAGRVQSVALRLICEREREILAFKPEEYWTVEALFKKQQGGEIFPARLLNIRGEKVKITNGDEAEKIRTAIEAQSFKVTQIEERQRVRNPFAPFITSTMQQESFRKLRYSAKRTMVLAQHLYEGVELGEEGPVGLITYMRTDSTRVSNTALDEVKDYILKNYGEKYALPQHRQFKTKKAIQDAHEAIRPTSLANTPEKVKNFLDKEHFKLYELVWNRFVASQMKEALYAQKSIDIAGGDFLFRATGSTLLFDGFLSVYDETQDEAAGDEDNSALPPLAKGDPLGLNKLDPKQHFTMPPPRYTESSLIKELEEKGIGRPSTYATILSNIQSRDYTLKEGVRFRPTELGLIVNDLLVQNFPDVIDVGFTAQMEEKLDGVEEGKQNWKALLGDFYKIFEVDLERAKKEMRNIKREEVPTDFVCEKCSKPMVIKFGKNGHFLACSGYPDCKSTKEFRRTDDGQIVIVKEETTDEKCSECGSPMLIRRGRFGKFLACSRYPECKGTKSITTGVKCPEATCEGGEVVEKRSRTGRTFYGCNKYPKCTFALWDKPVKKECPQCHAPFLIEKVRKSGMSHECRVKECGYKEVLDQ